MKPFAESYAAGETPIPCVTCNQQIKFHDLLETARDLGASLLATGHYVQKRAGAAGPALYRGADVSRDQSYFLFATTEAQLSQLIFPIGGFQKPEVRALARDFALPVSDKPDSQDICFVPNGRYTDVVARLNPNALADGDIVHVDGRHLGRHSGIAGFTVGQRKGLKIPLGEPLYVVRIEADANRVVVGPRDCLQTSGLILRSVNWLGDSPVETDIGEGLDVLVRIRSSQAPVPATLFRDPDGTIRVGLRDGELGVAAGQACVFYSDHTPEARVLGGGWIAGTLKPEWPKQAGVAAGGDPAAVPSRIGLH
jgi:tRNA-specific 2-thiouridylase